MKALGGGSRQIGFMAAAGIYALDNMIVRLQEDHDHIQMIADSKLSTLYKKREKRSKYIIAYLHKQKLVLFFSFKLSEK